jgi:hypothetical protein
MGVETTNDFNEKTHKQEGCQTNVHRMNSDICEQ